MNEEVKEAIEEFKREYNDGRILESDIIIELSTARIINDLIDKLQKENEELKDLKAELHAEVIKNHHLEDKVKVYEQQIDLEWVEENYIEKKILKRAEKIIDLMATELSRRPLMTYLDDERDDRLVILDNPKEIIKYYTKKAEE